MVLGYDEAWTAFLLSATPSRGSHALAVATSFKGLPIELTEEPDKHLPPITCEQHAAQDHLDLVRRRAKGEEAVGRGDGKEQEGPATTELKKLLKPKGQAKRLAALAAKHKCPPKYTEVVIKATPWTMEKILIEEPKAKKKKKKPKLGLQQNPQGPTLCGRHELINEGPFPLEKRLGELAAHCYYLWGDAKYLSYKAEGTSVEILAHTIERLARQADASARRMAIANKIPMSTVPPRLPLAVSAVSPDLAALTCLQPPILIKSEKNKSEANYFL